MIVTIRNILFWIVAPFLLLILGCDGCEGTTNLEESWDVVHYTEFGRQPIWSPDGDKLLFGDDTPGNAGLWIWEPGSDPVLLADDLPPHNWDYSWSNDGSKIAFSSPGASREGSSGVWVVDLNARNASNIYPENGKNVSWSFNDEWVAAEVYSPMFGGDVIALIKSTGNEVNSFLSGFKPKCSPQDGSIAFTDKEYSDNDRDGRLLVKSFVSGDTVQTLSGPGAVQWKWSKDGQSIFCIFVNYLNHPYSLTGYLVRYDRDGFYWEADTLSNRAGYPTVDGSGSQVAFMRESNSRWIGLWINREGSDIHIADYVMNPDFHPTEDKIAVNGSAGGIKILQRTR